jgi:hypothetical protein
MIEKDLLNSVWLRPNNVLKNIPTTLNGRICLCWYQKPHWARKAAVGGRHGHIAVVAKTIILV